MSYSKLSPSLIVERALQIFYAEGLQAVTVRKVAASLDVNAASLYWHVRDRSALYSLLTERIFRSCLDAIPAAESWQDWLRGFAIAIWNAQISHPDIRSLILLSPAEEAKTASTQAEIVGELTRRGMQRNQADTAQRSIQALVTGWSILKFQAETEQASFRESLEVLIGGWEAKVAGAPM